MGNSRHQMAFVAATLLVLCNTASGFPSGAGGCGSGGPAVGDSHVDFMTNAESLQEGTNGTLFDAATVVWLNGIQSEPNVPTLLPTGQDIVLEIDTFQVAMRGVLIRCEALDLNVDMTNLVTSDSNLIQPALSCDDEPGNVVGWTHVNASEKPSISVSVRLDEPATNITIDVTAVYANTGNLSVFAYSRYILTFESNSASSTSSPDAVAAPLPASLSKTVSPAAAIVLPPTTPSTSQAQSKSSAFLALLLSISWMSLASLR